MSLLAHAEHGTCLISFELNIGGICIEWEHYMINVNYVKYDCSKRMCMAPVDITQGISQHLHGQNRKLSKGQLVIFLIHFFVCCYI